MKKLLMLLTISFLAGISQAREFKSADGSKTVEAEFVRYNPRTGDVTLRMTNGRNMVTKADFFSEQDQEFFREQFRSKELEGALSVRGHDSLDRDAYKKDRLLISYTDADYIFTIENESDVALENLEVKYWVVTERYNLGNELNETSNGEARIPKLEAKAEEKIIGPKIRLITGAVPNHTTKNQNEAIQLANEAAKYGRDRNLGWRVEIYSADGKLLLADSSSIRVDRALGKDEDDE